MREMTEEEKQDIMMGLKAKWDDVHKQPQCRTFSVDTVSKVNRCEPLPSGQVTMNLQQVSEGNSFVNLSCTGIFARLLTDRPSFFCVIVTTPHMVCRSNVCLIQHCCGNPESLWCSLCFLADIAHDAQR